MIDITLIGTAALVPIPDRALTSALLTCGGRSILFDCGEGTQTAARRAEVSLMKTDVIALTHYHGDHIFGLPGLLQTMGSLNRRDPIYITGPEGLQDAMEPILRLTGWVNYDIRLVELQKDGLRLSELVSTWPEEALLSAFRTEHRVPSQGYCFELGRKGKFQPEHAKALGIPVNLWGSLQKGRCVRVGETDIFPDQVMGAPRKGLKFVFSGDTAQCDSLAEAAKDADLLICEATYGENDQATAAAEHGHMVFSQAAEIARRAGAKRLWLAHYSQMIEDPQDYLPNAVSVYEKAVCGADGMKITLRFEE